LPLTTIGQETRWQLYILPIPGTIRSIKTKQKLM